MNQKVILLGNEAIARGAYEAGVAVSSAYPGTPSTEISESLVQYKEDVYCEWAPNEKVALEVAIGASIVGKRAMASMKHVGLNVAADPLFTASYIGTNGGLVLVVADDPGLYSSQNEQDTRSIAIAAKVPVIEPSDSQEAKDFTKWAFDLSEEYDTPVIVRTTTRLSHSQTLVELGDVVNLEEKQYEKNIQKNVMVPGNARKKHPIVEENLNRLAKDKRAWTRFNRLEMGDRRLGFVTSSISYQYVKEVFPEASVLKIGLSHPLALDQIREFSENVDRLIVFEELDPIMENQIKAAGISCEGKELFSMIGEYSATLLRQVFQGEENKVKAKEVPIRPPILCPGCPHRSVFSVMKKLKLHGAGDIGCYTLGAQDPLNTIDTTICMGASISSLHGMERAKGKDFIKDWVAVIGDSTFLHTGVNSLMNMVYNKGTGTVMILDNSTTAMTGHQDNPATGYNLMGEVVQNVDLAKLCEALGVASVHEINAFDLKGLEKLLKEELAKDEVSVIITKSPCVLLKGKAIRHQYIVEKDKCRKCGLCLRPGCPALTKDENKITKINETMCNGCGLCYNLCPFDAITMVDSIIDKL
ncbi:MAG: indolepyruvate ferredoxin oxidoreductase subunit alpha [Tissierellia bacterium]|nr:indolepyruvate ferredoxin oxidoreductase subunit alpha [Tissierellia bacterium]